MKTKLGDHVIVGPWDVLKLWHEVAEANEIEVVSNGIKVKNICVEICPVVGIPDLELADDDYGLLITSKQDLNADERLAAFEMVRKFAQGFDGQLAKGYTGRFDSEQRRTIWTEL